jgi:hypothetical protein
MLPTRIHDGMIRLSDNFTPLNMSDAIAHLNTPAQYLNVKGKVVWGSRGIAPPFFTLSLDGGEWSALCPGHFTPREREPGTHWIGGWVGTRAGLDTME